MGKYLETKEQQPKEILAYLGPAGTFTELAAVTLQTSPRYEGVQLIECKSIADICDLVARGDASLGVVPIENSTAGDVKDTLCALTTLNLGIRNELVVPISHSLYRQPYAQIKRIASKDSALEQCRRYIQENYPDTKLEPVDSTALAVLMAAEDPGVAAIASRHASQVLNVAHRLRQIDSIEDNPFNVTTFIVIGRPGDLMPISGNDKTTFILDLEDRPGSLYAYLNGMKQGNINLNKIRSIGKSNDSVLFLMSIDGHQKDGNIAAILQAQTCSIKILGSYPRAEYVPPKVDGLPNLDHAIKQIQSEMLNGTLVSSNGTVVIFTLQDKIGVLHDAIEPFARRGINLTAIDSMPTRRAIGEYIFWLAFDRSAPDRSAAIEEMAKHCTQVVLLNHHL